MNVYGVSSHHRYELQVSYKDISLPESLYESVRQPCAVYNPGVLKYQNSPCSTKAIEVGKELAHHNPLLL
jgi:hypothetical protein